ncbi:protocadherin-10-like [Scyliorhinus canicula]|uniref:protocadherin-10-like n=1 Tax=Scyliorhinus canicula TaxID=7830 RepID=UPI0018F37D86|nr:protocadherin-10-like [Scyliorhinus canicula]XP_038652229.1 protocadherin-10-like [Scyliorhinus canicula]
MANMLSSRASFIFLLCISGLISGQIRYSIPEELEYGAFVGNIAEDLRRNAGELSGRNVRLVSDKRRQYIEVNLENGMLFINERIDREQLCGQSPSCSLSFQIMLENPSEMRRLAVEILDINDNAPSFSKDEYSFRIIEVIAPGTRLPLESAHDPDIGTNAISTYHISPNEHFGLRVQTRNDGTKSAELLLEKPLDREKQSTLFLVLTATDGGVPHRSATTRIVVNIRDANDNAPVFDHETYTTSVLENTPKGTLVIKLNAFDLDEGTNAELTYSFNSHVSQKARELFIVDSITGEIRVEGVLDFEESYMYELDVEAVDKGHYPMAGHAKVMVGLIDVNDNAPRIEVTSIYSTVPEDAQPGTVIATISVTDADSAENGQVKCDVPVDIPFKFEPSFNNNYKLVTSGNLDREVSPLYNISIRARDKGSPHLETRKNIMVTVSDVNDNSPMFTQSSYNVFVTENNWPGASIFTVTASDPDLDQNGDVSYLMLENNTKYASASPYVMINSKSGDINTLLSFDYELLKCFKIIVQAQDAGSPSLSSTAIVNVIILDQNDNAPIIVSPLAWNSSLAVEILRQSIIPGYMITKVIATDVDSGQNMRLSFQILEATDPSLFSLGRLSGEIRAARRFRDHDSTIHRVIIQVKDNGQPSLTSAATIFVSILQNVTENVSVRSHQPRSPEQLSELNAYLIIMFGSTSFIFLVIIIFLVVLKCKQNSNANYYSSTSCCCCMRRNSNEVFNRRAVPKEIPHYSGRQTLPISDTHQYTICLAPESAKSDFLFLKPCEATLPMNDLNVRGGSVRKL